MAETVGPPAPKNRICFLVVWFGEFPKWLPWFLLSCRGARGISWLIFSDQQYPAEHGSNVQFVRLNKLDFDKAVSIATGLDFRLSYGYKLCDIKPAYGHIFSEYIGDFDYWGYTDLDVIIGAPYALISDAIDANPDVITASFRFLVGHFTLIKNCEDLRLGYQKCFGWQEKFLSTDYSVFDERDFSDMIRSARDRRELTITEVSVWQEDALMSYAGRKAFCMLWWSGHLYDVLLLREFGYFHFIKSKYNKKFSTSIPPLFNGPFVLTKRGFMPISGFWSFLRAVLVFWIAFVQTLPWYLFQMVKVSLPKKRRVAIRRLMGLSVVEGDNRP